MCVVMTSVVGKLGEGKLSLVIYAEDLSLLIHIFIYLIFFRSFWLDNNDAKIKYPQMNVSH